MVLSGPKAIPYRKSNVDSPFISRFINVFNCIKPVIMESSMPARLLWGFGASAAIVFLMFQKKMLPLPIAKVVSKLYFYPTFPLTLLSRLGNFWTCVDKTVFLGVAPMKILGVPKMLHKQGVRGVVNMCYEYGGPTEEYARLGIEQLHLPCVDHCEPSVEQLNQAVTFIKKFQEKGEKVYVHCKAGHGRGASVALGWMMTQNKETSPKDLNAMLRSKRKVRKNLFEQKNMVLFWKSYCQ